MRSCENVDELRLSGEAVSSWPADAQRHLTSCLRCVQVQSFSERGAAENVPATLQAQIEVSILSDLSRVAPLRGVASSTGMLVTLALAVTALATWRLGTAGFGVRGTLQRSLDFAILGTALVMLSRNLAIRMMPGASYTLPLLGCLAGSFLVFLTATLMLVSDQWSAKFVSISLACWQVGTACGAASAPLFWLVLRRGYWIDRTTQAAAVGFLAGLVGVAVLEMYCAYLDRLHIATSHLGAAVTAGLFGGAIGRLRGRAREHR
ncbi:MAG: hypothetical protein ABIO24_14730 [Saprospiraceae bacterium]